MSRFYQLALQSFKYRFRALFYTALDHYHSHVQGIDAVSPMKSLNP